MNIYLRIGTLFEHNNKTLASVLFQILKYWLLDELNYQKIDKKLKEKYSLKTINKRFINEFLQLCRKAIANYIKSIYILEPLALVNANNHVSINENLFCHSSGEQVWVVGMINSETKNLRLEIVENRNATTLQKMIEKHVFNGNIIVSDAWSGYSFLNDIHSCNIHHVYNHGRGNFGRGLDSTSHIEGFWSELKSYVKKMYYSIQSYNFIYHLREAEYRRLIKNLNANSKLENFSIVIACVGKGMDNTYLSVADLLSLDYDTQFE